MKNIKLFEEFHFEETTDSRGRKFKTFKLEDMENFHNGYLPNVKSNIPFNELKKEKDYQGEYKFNEYVEKEFSFDGDNYIIHLLYAPYQDTHFECGWIIMKNNEPTYLVFIYEPYDCYVSEKRGLLTFNGHEEIIKLWLDDGEFEQHHTR